MQPGAGRAAIGRDDIGSLEPGKRADLAVWRTDGLELGGAADPVAGLVFSGPHRVDRLFVGGAEVVVRRRGSCTPTRRRSRVSTGVQAARLRRRFRRDRLDPRPRHRARACPPPGVRVELWRGDELVGSGETDDDGRIRELADGRARHLPHRLPAAVAVLPPRGARGRARRGPLPRPPARLLVRVRDLPRQLSVEELAELFEGRTRFVERLAELEDPLGRAREVAATLADEEKKEVLDAHPAIGAKTGLSARSAAEQGDATRRPPELDELNRRYEEKFGFRFVVFVNRRPKSELVPDPARAARADARGGAGDGARRARLDRGGPMAAVLAAFLGGKDYWWGWGDLRLPLAARGRGDRVDRLVVLLHRARQPPRAAEGASATPRAASAARCGRSTAAASTGSRSSRSRRSGSPSKLYWFKWEAYTTWLSGLRADHGRLLRARLDVPRRPVGRRPHRPRGDPDLDRRARARVARLRRAVPRCSARDERLLAVAVGALRRPRRLGRRRSSSRPRAAYIQVGAMLGTIMAANVFFVIIPMHWKLVRAKEAGEEPDPKWNALGKQRSVHNNYLTLPVVFAMLSNHFAFTYGHAHAWLILVALMALGAWMRHYFNLRHSRPERLVDPRVRRGRDGRARDRDPARRRARRRTSGPPPTLREVQAIVANRCAPCHSLSPDAARLQLAARRDRARDRGADRRGRGADQDGRGRLARDAARQRDGDDAGRAGHARALARLAVASRPCSRSSPPGFTFRARFEEADAPATVAAFRAILPVRGPDHPLPLERRVELDPVGRPRARHRRRERDLLSGARASSCSIPGGISETELLFPYGHCAFGSKAGPLAGNHFATVVEGLENLPELGRLTLWQGAQEISFREV